MAAVTSVESNATEQPRPSRPTGQTSGMVPQSRLHWRRLMSTVTHGGALQRRRRDAHQALVRLKVFEVVPEMGGDTCS